MEEYIYRFDELHLKSEENLMLYIRTALYHYERAAQQGNEEQVKMTAHHLVLLAKEIERRSK